jgi:FMN phosphatase YigB (HAD superfamily)
MESSPEQVAIIGDDVLNDLGGGAVDLGLHRFLGNPPTKKKTQTLIFFMISSNG